MNGNLLFLFSRILAGLHVLALSVARHSMSLAHLLERCQHRVIKAMKREIDQLEKIIK